MPAKKLIPKFYQDYWEKAKDDTNLFVKIYISPDSKNILTPTAPQLDFIDRAQSGLYDELWMAGGNSSGKCLGINEKVILSSGMIVKAGDLIGKEFSLPTLDNRGRVVMAKAFATDNGERKVWEVLTQSGVRLVRTSNHPLFVSKIENPAGKTPKINVLGFTPVKNIVAGDFIASARRLPFGNKVVDKDLIRKWQYKKLPPALYWDKVVSVKELGLEKTVSISVPKYHTFLTEVYEHNTWTGKFLATKFACYKIKPKKRWRDYDDWYHADYDVLCTAPEQKQAIELWEHIEESFKNSPILRYKVADITTGTRRATHPRITLKNGARIDAVGLHDKGKHIEGQAYDLILINEPADVRHLIHAVEKVLIPRTWRRGGIIAGFGTPKGKNEYYNLWRRGQRELNGYENPYYDKRVFSCYVDSRSNPYADQSQIRKFLDTKNDDLIEERVKGRFSDMQMLAFPDQAIDAIVDDSLSAKIGRSSFRRYLHGVDFGRKEDYTVCVTFDITDVPYTMVNFYRKGGGVATWEEIFSDLLDIYNEYGGDFICDASASAGDIQMEWLSDMNIPYYPFQFGGSPAKKVGLINNLQRYISEKKIRFPAHQQLLEELHSYPRDMKDKGLTTDCVMALALACYGIENYRISGYPEPLLR